MALVKMISFAQYDRFETYIDRLHGVLSAEWVEKLDATDELTITCMNDVSKGDRIVWLDGDGYAHEHIVDETERIHDSDGAPYTTFKAINSISDTWDDWISDKRPNGTADVALTSLLQGTHWKVGTCDQPGSASHTFYHQKLREALSDFYATWGGELETEIVLRSDGFGIAERRLGCRASRGNQTSPKRFTWRKDMTSVKRYVANSNPKTRIYCYGKGVETESGGYGRRLTISEVNNGLEYVEDATATAIWGHKDASGNTIPACDDYTNEECEDASQLKTEGLAYLNEVKEPKITYTATVIFLKAFGRDWEGFRLGDNVLIVDKGFNDEGVRLHGRISSITHDLLSGDGDVEFGNLTDAMADMFSSIAQTLKKQSERNASYDNASGATISWLRQLQSALNEAFNNVGTYKFESFEKGDIYSNVALDQETGLPVEITSEMWAMNLNGHGLRLAYGLTAQGEWNWGTFITGRQVLADFINAGTMAADRVRTGFLTDEKGLNYWNLSTGAFSLSSTATVGGKTVATIAEDAVDAQTQTSIFNKLTNNGQTQGIYLQNGKLYVNASYMKAGIITDGVGRNSWNLSTGAFTTNYMNATNITASGTFECGNYYRCILNSSGQLQGKRDGLSTGYIDYTSSSKDLSTGNILYGIQMQAQGIVRISSPRIAAAASSNTSTTATFGVTGTLNVVHSITANNDGSISWTYGTVKFINGLATNV